VTHSQASGSFKFTNAKAANAIQKTVFRIIKTISNVSTKLRRLFQRMIGSGKLIFQ
jgi:hypothetical protein